MPTYIVVTPLRNGGPKPLPPGQPVDLGEREGDALVVIGALARAPADAAALAPVPPVPPVPPAPPVPPREKPLGQQNKAELRATAAREGVEVTEHATNLQIVQAVEAKRAAQ